MKTRTYAIVSLVAAVAIAWASAQFTYAQAVKSINSNFTYFAGPDMKYPEWRYSWRAKLMWPVGFSITTVVWHKDVPVDDAKLATHVIRESYLPFASWREDTYPNPRQCIIGFCPQKAETQ